MGVDGAGLALKTLQWFLRGVQFACASIILGIYSYFLGTLSHHKMNVPTSVRAVEGISGFAALYSILSMCVLCCIAGVTFFSFFAMTLDIAFAAAFIYVAVANRGGASSCDGNVDTVFGSGDSNTEVQGNDDSNSLLPSLYTACKLESACLAIAIVAIFFYIFACLNELALGRNRASSKRKDQLAKIENSNYPQAQGAMPANGGYQNSGFNQQQQPQQPQGFLGQLSAAFSGLTSRLPGGAQREPQDPDKLTAEHPAPGQLNGDSNASRRPMDAYAAGGPQQPDSYYANKYGGDPTPYGNQSSNNLGAPSAGLRSGYGAYNPYDGSRSPGAGQAGQQGAGWTTGGRRIT